MNWPLWFGTGNTAPILREMWVGEKPGFNLDLDLLKTVLSETHWILPLQKLPAPLEAILRVSTFPWPGLLFGAGVGFGLCDLLPNWTAACQTEFDSKQSPDP